MQRPGQSGHAGQEHRPADARAVAELPGTCNQARLAVQKHSAGNAIDTETGCSGFMQQGPQSPLSSLNCCTTPSLPV